MANEWTPDNPWSKETWDAFIAQLEAEAQAYTDEVTAALQQHDLVSVVNRDAPQMPQQTPIRRRTPPRKRERRSKR